MRPRDVTKALNFFIENKFPLLLKGAPGVGKSSLADQSCITLNQDLIISHPVVSDPTDFKGLPFPNKNGTAADFLPFGDLLKLINADRPTVFFLDDLGQAPAMVQAACMQLLLARQINGKKISDHITFLAATNRRMDKAGVQGILSPVKSRFVSIIEVETNLDDWVNWAYYNNIPAELIAFLRYRPNHMEESKSTNDIVNTPNPRTIENVGKIMYNGAPKGLEFQLYSGAAGNVFASELMGFLKIFRELPDIDTMLKTPHKADVPRDPAILFAVSGALINRVTKANIGNLVKYIAYLPPEFQVLIMMDIIKKKKSLASDSAYTAWAIANSDVILDIQDKKEIKL